ncbi:MAG: glycosyltransferase family 4 protein [Chloroflexota bacterium]|nr:glycosyltransferase family 4 protein [Chloroflexota bacterium]
MKTILLISRCPPYPLHLGDRLIIWHLARELSGRGHTIDLLALYDRDDDPQRIAAYREFFRHIELIRESRRGGEAYLQRLFDPSKRFARNADISFNPDLWTAIKRHLRSHDYDVAHCFGSVSVYEYHPLFADKPNLITPYESHALFLQSAARQGQLSAALRLPIVRRFERFMYAPYDRTVVIAEKDRDMLLSLQPQLSVDVIPNGIELAQFPWQGEDRDGGTLLFVGNFEYRPNQDAARLLIERIMPEIWRQMPGAQLQLVGNDPPEWMLNLADRRILVTGRVPEVQPFLARATAFVCPLRMGAGQKNKALEALAMGIPLVATPLSVDGINVEHGQSAIIAEAKDIAAAALHVLRDEELRRRLSLRGRELVETEYTWQKTAASYERLYDELTRQP